LSSHSDLTEFSLVVEKIYDAAADPQHWFTALDHINEYIEATATSLHFIKLNANQEGGTILYARGFTNEFLLDSARYAHDWSAQIGILNWPIGAVNHLPDILPREEFINGNFYKNAIEPHGENDYIGMVALKEKTNLISFTASTNIERGTFAKQSVDRMKLLAPHICGAAKIGLALEMKSLTFSLMETTLNSLNAAVYLLSRDGSILFMNRTAEGHIKNTRALRISENRLIPIDANAALEFQKRVSDSVTLVVPSIALPDDQGGLIATILPHGAGLRQNLSFANSTVGFTVFVQDPAAELQNPGLGFAKLFGLTAGEQRALSVLAMGNGPQEAANVLGISLNTVKSHLRNIFEKTGTNGQTELMQLMSKSAAPVSIG
jgi:DNA-binding CsgD family transcriptional regulator